MYKSFGTHRKLTFAGQVDRNDVVMAFEWRDKSCSVELRERLRFCLPVLVLLPVACLLPSKFSLSSELVLLSMHSKFHISHFTSISCPLPHIPKPFSSVLPTKPLRVVKAQGLCYSSGSFQVSAV